MLPLIQSNAFTQAMQKNGFSLIEIMVALTILAVIGVVAIPNFRQFNSDQELTNVTSNVIRMLQQAQTAAQSQIACVNTQPLNTNNPAVAWDFIVNNPTNFRLQAECINGQTGGVPAPVVYDSATLVNVTIGTTYRLTNNSTGTCATPSVLSFYTYSSSNTTASPPPLPGQVVQLSCAGTYIPSLASVILNINQTGFTSRVVTVEANGTVHQ